MSLSDSTFQTLSVLMVTRLSRMLTSPNQRLQPLQKLKKLSEKSIRLKYQFGLKTSNSQKMKFRSIYVQRLT